MQQQNVLPAYEVEHIDETVTETHYVRKGDRNETKEVEVPFGYMVYLRAGHSIRVRDDAELARLGFDKPADLIDEDGEVVGNTAQHSLKRNVQRRKGASKQRRADTSAVDANQ